jgi:hypothetical protein
MEFFYEGEHIKDPLGIGKDYGLEDISMMMGDLEEFSRVEGKELDRMGVYSDKITGFKDRKEVIYNIMVAECLRGVVFNDIGDIVNLCLRYDDG